MMLPYTCSSGLGKYSTVRSTWGREDAVGVLSGPRSPPRLRSQLLLTQRPREQPYHPGP
jgi:hypothetical protein